MRNLLLTGVSGVGKSTLLHKISQHLSDKTIRGTYSQVIYKNNQRLGWHLENYSGDSGLLAHVDIQSDHNMGKYGVDMDLFHRITLPQMKLDKQVYVYLIDEIGIIAPWSSQFIDAMNALLNSDQRVVAIVRYKSLEYPDQVKQRSDITLWEVTRDNREQMFYDILEWIENT